MTTEERVRRLEKEVRWTRVIGAVMTVALACVVLVGAGQDQEKPKVLEEVRAKRFVVVADDGIERGELRAGLEGGSLTLHDTKKEVKLELSVVERMLREGDTFSLIHCGASLHLSSYGDDIGLSTMFGATGLNLSSRGHTANLGIRSNGFELVLNDKDGKVTFKAPE